MDNSRNSRQWIFWFCWILVVSLLSRGTYCEDGAEHTNRELSGGSPLSKILIDYHVPYDENWSPLITTKVFDLRSHILSTEPDKTHYTAADLLSRIKRRVNKGYKSKGSQDQAQNGIPSDAKVEKFFTQHLFNPSEEAKKDGRKWNEDPGRWSKKQWNTFFATRVKSEPGLAGKKLNTFVVASNKDFTESVHKGQKLYPDDKKSDLHVAEGLFKTYTLKIKFTKGVAKVKQAKEERETKVIVGVDDNGNKNPEHLEPINKHVVALKGITGKEEGKAQNARKRTNALRVNRNNGHGKNQRKRKH